jgi:hypothetical protein
MRDVMVVKMRNYLGRAMKQCEIDTHFRTDSMYIPKDKQLADMDPVWLRNNLCHAAQGDIGKCSTCPAPCMIGKALQRSVVGG